MKESSLIKTITWNDGLLYVVLKTSDKIYEYADVPEDVFESFKAAESLGSFFSTKIKGHYDEQSFDQGTLDIPEDALFPFPKVKPPEGFNHRAVKPEKQYKINKPRPWNFRKDK